MKSAPLYYLFILLLVACTPVGCTSQREPPKRVTVVEEPIPDDRPEPLPKLVPPSPPTKDDPKPPPVIVKPPSRPLPKEIVNSIGMKLLLIPAGKFIMGSPASEKDRGEDEAAHEVEIGKTFFLGAYEVTQFEYLLVQKKNPSHFSTPVTPPADMDTRRFPVESVTWKDAIEFCRRLSDLPEEKSAGRVYRLPTEAEWEYACRAGQPTPVTGGASLAATQANFDGTQPYGSAATGPNLQRPVAVGSYAGNAFNLYDMHGNVWEWCADWYQDDYYRKSPAKDPTGSENGLHRVMRGGCFLSAGAGCRSAVRGQAEPNSKLVCIGFRVACDQK